MSRLCEVLAAFSDSAEYFRISAPNPHPCRGARIPDETKRKMVTRYGARDRFSPVCVMLVLCRYDGWFLRFLFYSSGCFCGFKECDYATQSSFI